MVRVVNSGTGTALETLTGWVSNQHDLFEDESVYGFGLDDLQSSLPAQRGAKDFIGGSMIKL